MRKGPTCLFRVLHKLYPLGERKIIMKKKFITLTIILAASLGLMPANVTEASEDNIGFSVRAVLPENQQAGVGGYFDLRMTPDQVQKIEVEVRNTSNEEATYDINLNQAYTNKSGFIDYAEKDVEADPSLTYKVNEFIDIPNEITVPAKSSGYIPLTISMPATEFDGSVMAGIQILRNPNRGKDTGGQFSSVFGYVVGLKLTENDNEVKRDLKMNDVRADITIRQSSIIANLQNPTMDAIGKMNYVGKIYPKGEKKNPFHEFSYIDKNMSMAPNSNYDFAVQMGDKVLKAGDYVLELTVTDGKGNQWDFDKEFTITEEKASAVNKIILPGSPENKAGLPAWVYIIAGVLAGMITLLVGMLIKSHKRRPAI